MDARLRALVIICLSGCWRVCWGTHGDESIELDYLDGICVPPGVMRSFENVATDSALLLSILGGKSPGHVAWSSSIRGKLRESIR
ncbi:MAG: hypothetical protein ACR2RB_18775 [Gammaproteobacteria bacterium]